METAQQIVKQTVRAVRFIGPLNIVFASVAWVMYYEACYKKVNVNSRYSYTMPYVQSAKITRNLYETL